MAVWRLTDATGHFMLLGNLEKGAFIYKLSCFVIVLNPVEGVGIAAGK